METFLRHPVKEL